MTLKIEIFGQNFAHFGGFEGSFLPYKTNLRPGVEIWSGKSLAMGVRAPGAPKAPAGALSI